MSSVTGILICFSFLEDYREQEDGTGKFPLIEELNSWLNVRSKPPLVQLDDNMCCGKHPQMYVFGGGYGSLDDEEFLALFHSLPWEEPDEVFMILNPEHAPMTVVKPRARDAAVSPQLGTQP